MAVELVSSDRELTVADYEEVLADHRRLVRELDVLLNGAGAAKQASLCDIVGQLQRQKCTPTSNLRSIFRTGQLFMEGAYSDEREWVDADEYRLLQRMHRQMCEIAAMRWDEIERLTIGLRRAFNAMDGVTVFVTSRERIKRPEGEQWWHEEKVAVFHALQPPAAPEPRDG